MADGGYTGMPRFIPKEASKTELAEHEQASQARYESLSDQHASLEHKLDEVLTTKEEYKMGMADNLMDKINVNVGGESGGGAAGMLPLAMAAMNNRDGRDGLGGPLLGAAIGGFVGAAVGRNRGGLFGGDGDGGNGGAETRLQTNADTLAILAATNRVGDTVAAVGATNTINLLQQTNEIQQLASANAALIAAGTAATERSVTNTGTVLLQVLNNINQNISEQGCKSREVTQAGTTAVLQAISAAEINELRRRAETAERSIEVNALRSQVEVNQTVTTTQAQAQGQFQVQAQFQDIGNTLRQLCGSIALVHQEARSTNANIIAGNAGAVTTGAQTSTPTNVNA